MSVIKDPLPQLFNLVPGKPGENGLSGAPGHKGDPRVDDRIGEQGPVGPPGPPGTVPESVIEQLRANFIDEVTRVLSCKGIASMNPATSCKEIHDCDPTAPSGYYWVNTTTGPLQVYCQMDTNNCGNITGGWMRAAYINMTDVSASCPQGLTYTVESSTRMCTRSHTNKHACSSVIFPTHRVPYTKVYGRAQGYQYWSTITMVLLRPL